MQYLDALLKMKEWYLFVSKANHSISQVIQVYAPTTNAKEAEIEQFYGDLQDLLELTPQNDVLFIIVHDQARDQCMSSQVISAL